MRSHPVPLTEARVQEAALLERCKGGDARAIEQLFGDHFDGVERVVRRLLGPSPDLEDLVQATFLEALKNLGRFRGEASFKTWVTSIATHVVHHHLRAGKVRRALPLEVVPEDALAPAAEDREFLLDERRLSTRFHRLLDRISAKKRIAFVLFIVEGRSVEEVAALMGATQVATRSRVFFARRELRALIAGDPQLSAHVEALLGRRAPGDERSPT